MPMNLGMLLFTIFSAVLLTASADDSASSPKLQGTSRQRAPRRLISLYCSECWKNSHCSSNWCEGGSVTSCGSCKAKRADGSEAHNCGSPGCVGGHPSWGSYDYNSCVSQGQGRCGICGGLAVEGAKCSENSDCKGYKSGGGRAGGTHWCRGDGWPSGVSAGCKGKCQRLIADNKQCGVLDGDNACVSNKCLKLNVGAGIFTGEIPAFCRPENGFTTDGPCTEDKDCDQRTHWCNRKAKFDTAISGSASMNKVFDAATSLFTLGKCQKCPDKCGTKGCRACANNEKAMLCGAATNDDKYACAKELAVDLGKATMESIKQLGECLSGNTIKLETTAGCPKNLAEIVPKDGAKTVLKMCANPFPGPAFSMGFTMADKLIGEFGDKFSWRRLEDEFSTRRLVEAPRQLGVRYFPQPPMEYRGSFGVSEPENRRDLGAFIKAGVEIGKCWKNAQCSAGVGAKFQTKFDVTPKLMGRIAAPNYADLDKTSVAMKLDIDFTVTTGVSVLASGACSYHTTHYFPPSPMPVAVACFFTACVSVFVQGMVKIGMDGTLVAGATGVHQVKFGASGALEVSMDKFFEKLNFNFDPLNPFVDCGSKPNCFMVKKPTSSWRLEAHGHMNARVAVQAGPIISLMVTPGIGSIWMTTMPWIAAEATLYGNMLYENSGGDFKISDEIFKANRLTKVNCGNATKVPAKATYSKAASTGTQGKKTKKWMTPEIPEATLKNKDTCLAMAITARAGLELSLGAVPPFLGTRDLKVVLKSAICANVGGAAGQASAYVEGMILAAKVLNPGVAAVAKGAEMMSTCMGLPESILSPTETAKKAFAKLEPACNHMIDVLFSYAPFSLNYNVKVPEYCKDIAKFYTGDTCADKVGCNAFKSPAPPALGKQAKCETIKGNDKFCGENFAYNPKAASALCASSKCNANLDADKKACCGVFAYLKVGTGVAGGSEEWLGGHNEGVEKCYKRVMADSRCAKDYFSYAARGDGNCGCKKNKDALKVRATAEADYYRIPTQPAKCETIKNNGNFCGTNREYNPKAAGAFCMSASCSANSVSDKKTCCRISGLPAKCETITNIDNFCGENSKYNPKAAGAFCVAETCKQDNADRKTCCAPIYSKAGQGVAGNDEVWLGGHNKGVEKCFKRVMADSRCAKDYFSYAARGDGNCGCKALNPNPLQVRGTNEADYYRIDPETLYSKEGQGVAGGGEVWLGGHNQGVERCHKRVMADSRCAKDYFTYVARGDGNCGCKENKGPLNARSDSNADYYRVNTPYSKVGLGIAGDPDRWLGGNNQGVLKCFERVVADSQCQRDYFSYSARGDGNCGCKASGGPLKVKSDDNNNVDYYRIDPTLISSRNADDSDVGNQVGFAVGYNLSAARGPGVAMSAVIVAALGLVSAYFPHGF